MGIVPVGKKRFMIAQMNSDSLAGGGELDTGMNQSQAQQFGQEEAKPALDPTGLGDENMSPEDDMGERPVNDLEDQVEEVGKPEASITKNIIEFLVGVGYPLRRLRDFKSQFYSEKGGNDGGAQVTITLPNQLYDDPDSVLPGKAVKSFVQGLQNDHGLHYEGYDKSDDKLILKLSRIGQNDRMEQMQEGFGDVLDQVYGSPDKGSGGSNNAEASTMREMIKLSKINIVEKLSKQTGESNADSTNK